jgi:pimeloyl-ACP methyl ester carboxylesterase
MIKRLILLPGTLCDQRLFAALARRLRPGVAVHVARWRDLLRTQQPFWWRQGHPPINLLGYSLGGIWALQQLQARAHDGSNFGVERLALLGSNAEAAGRKHRRRSREQLRLLRRQGPVALARAAKGQYFAHRPKRWQAQLVLNMAMRTPTGVARKQIHLAANRTDSLHAFANFPGPVAIFSGTHDRLCPAQLQRRLQSARGDAQAQALTRCGHMLPLEAPGRLALAIQRWLERAPASGPIITGVLI